MKGKAEAVFDAMQGWSYAQRVQQGMAARGLSLRALATQSGYSYEQVRRVRNGEPVGSRHLNRLLAEILCLDEQQMWRVALSEKAEKKYSREGVSYVTLPAVNEFVEMWDRLDISDRQRVLALMRRLDEARRVEQEP